jgi:Zn-dependent peptidase ImmA (M78 family)
MNLAQDVFKRLIKGWNERPLTEKDFYKLCRKFGILVFEEDSEEMNDKGEYTVVEGVPIIFLDRTLKGLERLWVMFHELGHHLLHAPETCFFSEGTVNKEQSEANAFAACSLIPKPAVTQLYLWDLYDVDEFATKLFDIRLALYDDYKI